MDYNIWVKLQNFKTRTRTSSTGKVAKTGERTSTSKRDFGKSMMLKSTPTVPNYARAGGKVFGASVAMMIGTAKTAERGSRLLNMISGNEYRASRQQDALSIVNPYGFVKRAVKTTLQGHFNTIRENKAIDYQRKITGMSLPNRNDDDDGITF